jgi:P27 family predicted phage terminase small subunit
MASWEPRRELTGDARAAWRHVVGLLREAGNLDRTDPNLVEAYALNVELMRQAKRVIKAKGVVLTTGRGAIISNPACAILNSASMRLKAIVNDLGLCPASSDKAAGNAAKSDSKWDGLLGIAAG